MSSSRANGSASGAASPSRKPSYSLIGYPISHSLAPTFQNTCFDLEGDLSQYELWSTSRLNKKVLDWIRSDEFRGAAVTMPLKATIIPYLDDITPESHLTGAVNTIVKVKVSSADGSRLIGTNTDYLGIVISLRTALLAQSQSPLPSTSSLTFQRRTFSCAVIGGGATTRSAILALHRLGLGPILLVNRDEAEVKVTMDWFEQTALDEEGLELLHVENPGDVNEIFERKDVPPIGMIVGAIPAILPQTPAERMVYATATHLFTLPRQSSHSSSGPDFLPPPSPPIFMDMAYYPRPTPLTQIARALGWQTVDGMQSMIEQGFAQQRMWRLGMATVEAGTRVGVLKKETEDEVRRRMEVVPDVKTGDVEIDRADEI